MRPALPDTAHRALDAAMLCHVAVRTDHGPHLTPVVFVLDGGRLWFTTARSSVKARRLREDPAVAGLVGVGGMWVAFRGTARTYDALDPFTWPAAAVAGPRLVRAAALFSVKNARFFAGYAVDAPRVPLAWTPPGRVFVGVDLTSGHVVDPAERLPVASWGAWPGGARRLHRYRSSFRALPRTRPLDLRAPREVRASLGEAGDGALALDGPGGLTVLPARWRRVAGEGAYDAVLPTARFELSGGADGDAASVAVDRASRWRASEMRGLLVQGRAQVFSTARTRSGAGALRRRLGVSEDEPRGPDTALVRIRPSRVVWWSGWARGSARAPVSRTPR